MICKVRIDRMEFRAYHGCYDLEKRVGNNFTVDISFDVEVGDAVAGDDVTKTVNYVEVYDIVRDQMSVASNIIEHVASRIIGAVKERFPEMISVEVTVSKLAPPLGGKSDRVSVTMAG